MSGDRFRNELRKSVTSSRWFHSLLLLSGTVLLPLLNALLINLATSGKCQGSGYALAVGAIMQLGVAAILIVRERQIRDPSAILLEAEDKCRELGASEQELARQSEACRMVRSAFDALNQQSCQLAENPCSFSDGLRPIIEKITASMWTVLGCTTNRYTIEAYFDSWHPSESNDSLPKLHGNYSMVFFASPAFQPQNAAQLGDRHPAVLMNWRAGVAQDSNEITNLSKHYFVDGKRIASLYFNRYAVVTIPAQCESDHLGLLVLTADQEAPFAANVLDTLSFVATIISVYYTKYKDCLEQRRMRVQIGGLEAMRPHWPPAGHMFVVERATYGLGATQKDVTDPVRILARGEPPFFSAENENLGGDPLRSVVKELTIEYSLGTDHRKKTIREHQLIKIP